MFYTYLWLREDGTPYYVGKGKGNRAFTSSRHMIKCPTNLERIVILHCGLEQEALAQEIELIALYGRKDLGTGCLRNMTGGGDGVYKPSAKRAIQMKRVGMQNLSALQSACTFETRSTAGKIGGAIAGRITREKGVGIHAPGVAQAAASLGGRTGNHNRYHIARNIINFACALCTASL